MNLSLAIPDASKMLIFRSADLSLEFLMGRALDNAMLNVGLKDVAKSEFLSA